MDILFLMLGLLVGILGTLVGAGGGFLLTPILIFVLPQMDSHHLTAISMLAIFANSCSGTIGYTRHKQIHWRSVVAFSITSVPGAFLGIFIGEHLSRASFESLFSIFLIIFGIFIFQRSFHNRDKARVSDHVEWQPKKIFWGSIMSFGVGVLSTLLGIGGGIVHVPMLSHWLGYPVHIAAGTSHAILAFTSGFAVLEHFFKNDYSDLPAFVFYMALGLVIGAQIGAKFSKRVPSHIIMRILGLAVISVALRILWRHFV